MGKEAVAGNSYFSLVTVHTGEVVKTMLRSWGKTAMVG